MASPFLNACILQQSPAVRGDIPGERCGPPAPQNAVFCDQIKMTIAMQEEIVTSTWYDTYNAFTASRSLVVLASLAALHAADLDLRNCYIASVHVSSSSSPGSFGNLPPATLPACKYCM
jgi:hypothetical protein